MLAFYKKNLLLFIVGGAVMGILLGVSFPAAAIKTEIFGEMFINALKMLVIPMIVTSMIMGVANLKDMKTLGTLGAKTITYYTITTFFAVSIGLIVVNIIRPGVGSELIIDPSSDAITKKTFSILDVLRGMVHPNLVEAAVDFKILPIIVISLIFGIAAIKLGEKARAFIEWTASVNTIVMAVVTGVILLTPIGVLGLIAAKLGHAGGASGLAEMLNNLSAYFTTVVAGLGFHGFVILPTILFFFAKRNPLIFAKQVGKALVTAFSTASSYATLPFSMECSIDEAKVSQKSASVVLPLGATMNMDGTALYSSVAAMFIAYVSGHTLTLGDQITIALTATLSSVGAAGIPQAGLMTLIIVLESVQLPIAGIAMILPIDWLLDRFRTTVNVWGDNVGAAVMDTEKKTIRENLEQREVASQKA